MGKILDYAEPEKKTPIRTLALFVSVAIVVQVFFFAGAAPVSGDFLYEAVLVRVFVGFWVGASMVAFRRARQLTVTDRLYLALGFPILFVAMLAITEWLNRYF
jgi:uncharacterized membrane protein